MTTRSIRFEFVAFALALQLIVLAVGFAALLAWPAPRPERTTIAAAVAALRSGDTRYRHTHSSTEPAQTSALLARSVAAALEIDAGNVRAAWLDEFADVAGSGHFVANVAGHEALIDSSDAGFTLRSGDDVVLPPSLAVPAFTASIRGADGHWTSVAPRSSPLAWWQWRGLAAFGAATLLVAPLAWFAARRVARPLRELAERLEHAAPDAPTDEPSAPSEVAVVAAAVARLRRRVDTAVGARVLGIAQLAHDLRTPLTSLRLRVECAESNERDAMVRDIERLAGYVDAMLAASRGDAAQDPVTHFDLAALVRECAGDPAYAARPPIVVEPLPSFAFAGRREALRRVLANLIENAQAHAAHVWLALRTGAEEVQLRVEDDGPGVDATQATLLLAPYVRGSDAPSRGGAGLGLSIVAELVDAQGGTLTLGARDGGGLAVEIALPVD